MLGWPLQSGLGCYTSQGDRLACVFNDLFAATGGEALFGLLLSGVLLLTFYIAPGGSIGLAAVVLVLVGAVLVPILPGSVAGLAGSLVIIGLASGIYVALRTYGFTTQ